MFFIADNKLEFPVRIVESKQVRNHFQNSRSKIVRKLALADLNTDADFNIEKFAQRMRIWIQAQLCGFGCRFLHSFADLVADSVKLCIILQSFASFCLYHYYFVDMDANFCIVLRI